MARQRLLTKRTIERSCAAHRLNRFVSAVGYRLVKPIHLGAAVMSEAVESGNPENSPIPIAIRPTMLPAIAGPIVVRARLSRVVFLAIAMALSAAAGSTIGAMAAVRILQAAAGLARRCAQHRSEQSARRDHAIVGRDRLAEGERRQQRQGRECTIRQDRRSCRPAQTEPAARVQKLSELLEKLDRRTAAARGASSRTRRRRRRKSPARSRPSSRTVRRWWPAGSFAKCSTGAP